MSSLGITSHVLKKPINMNIFVRSRVYTIYLTQKVPQSGIGNRIAKSTKFLVDDRNVTLSQPMSLSEEIEVNHLRNI